MLTKLHTTQKSNQLTARVLIPYMKERLKNVEDKINDQIKKNIEEHWEKIFKSINYKNPDKFFPIVNRIFRPKPMQEMPHMNIKKTETIMQQRSQCNIAKVVEEIDEYVIEH